MSEGKSYFICGLPYQLPIKENLLDKEQVADEMSESDFNEVGWLMEMECMWFGESEKAFFKFEDLEKNRVLPKAIYPKSLYTLIKNKEFKYEPKKENEIRLLSCDISGMSSAKNNNDASVYTILRLIPSKNGLTYDKHVCYMESKEGGHAQTQAIRIRQLFDEFDCDYIVIDTHSFGLGVYDQLVMDLYDKELNRNYEAFSCINDDVMANRCMSDNAPKVIYSIKANSQLNSEMHITVRDNLKRGKLRLLTSENEAKEFLGNLKGYHELPMESQVEMLVPYMQITLLVNEMINLERVGEDSVIKLKEPSTKRKDRYSSLGYAIYIAKELEAKLRKPDDNTGWDEMPMLVSEIKFTL